MCKSFFKGSRESWLSQSLKPAAKIFCDSRICTQIKYTKRWIHSMNTMSYCVERFKRDVKAGKREHREKEWTSVCRSWLWNEPGDVTESSASETEPSKLSEKALCSPQALGFENHLPVFNLKIRSDDWGVHNDTAPSRAADNSDLLATYDSESYTVSAKRATSNKKQSSILSF